MEKIILLGCGGHAKSMVDSIESMKQFEIVGFTDKNLGYQYKGIRVLGDDSILPELYTQGITNAAVCVGYMGKGKVRNALYAKLKQIGYTLPVIIDASAIISQDVIIGEGTFVGKNAVINADAKIGKMTIINSGVIIEHESSIENFVHIACGTVICGNCKIGEGSFIGANSTIIQDIQVGKQGFIGAGSVVIRDVESNCTVVGVPAKTISINRQKV